MALSSTEAKYRVLTNTTNKIRWLRNILSKISLDFLVSPYQGVNALTSNLVFNARIKHVDIDAHHVI